VHTPTNFRRSRRNVVLVQAGQPRHLGREFELGIANVLDHNRYLCYSNAAQCNAR